MCLDWWLNRALLTITSVCSLWGLATVKWKGIFMGPSTDPSLLPGLMVFTVFAWASTRHPLGGLTLQQVYQAWSRSTYVLSGQSCDPLVGL